MTILNNADNLLEAMVQGLLAVVPPLPSLGLLAILMVALAVYLFSAWVLAVFLRDGPSRDDQ